MEKSLAAVFPDLIEEWSDKNLPLTPADVSYGTHKTVWWKGSCGHEWQASVHSRTSGKRSGCPYCSGNRILPGFNDLASRFPAVAEEWPDRNLPLTPDMVSAFSNKRVWWKAKCGHEWFGLISSRSDGHGCPYCNDKKMLRGFNDFATLHPELALQWSDKNLPLMPDSISEKKPGNLWWTCPNCGNDYQAWISSRLSGSKCPHCTGRIVKDGVNDLATTDPELAAEWDYERNGDIKPTQIHRTTKKLYWWKSSCGHSWKAKVYDRAVHHIPCTVCEEEFYAALPELLTILYAGRNGMKVELGTDKAISIPLDIYIPELRLAMEYEPKTEVRRREQQVKQHICESHGILYGYIRQGRTPQESAQIIRAAFKARHIHVSSDIAEDIRLAKSKYFSMKEREKERRQANEI